MPWSKEQLAKWRSNPKVRKRLAKEGRYYYHRGNGRDAYFIRKYGITAKERDRLAELQDWRCACCGAEETVGIVRPHRLAGEIRLVVDHDHATGKFRAMLCSDCNIKLGHMETPKLKLLLRYIRKHENKP